MTVVEAALASSIVAGTPLLLAALGELLGEKVGVLNIGLEGIMLMGAVGGIIVSLKSGSVTLGLVGGVLTGAVFTLVVFAIPAIALQGSHILVGFALWLVGIGLSAQIGNPYAADRLQFRLSRTEVPLLHDLPFLGPILFNQYWTVYLAIALALAASFMLRRTRHGVNMRAIGENPDAAHAMGVSVQGWQAFYTGICGALSGLGGAMLGVIVAGSWRDQMTAGRGWMALALVVFAAWNPLWLITASFLFGFFLILADLGQVHDWPIAAPVLSMGPYVVTVLVLIVRATRELWTGERSMEPAALGEVFVRR